jgi:hypothetical protein
LTASPTISKPSNSGAARSARFYVRTRQFLIVHQQSPDHEFAVSRSKLNSTHRY